MNFKQAREAAGLSTEALGKLAGWSTAAINGLEVHNKGSPRLRAKVTEILTGLTVSVSPDSKLAAIANDRPEDYNVDDLLEEITKLKEQLHAVERAAHRLKKGKL
jgi:hypothetical protein